MSIDHLIRRFVYRFCQFSRPIATRMTDELREQDQRYAPRRQFRGYRPCGVGRSLSERRLAPPRQRLPKSSGMMSRGADAHG